MLQGNLWLSKDVNTSLKKSQSDLMELQTLLKLLTPQTS